VSEQIQSWPGHCRTPANGSYLTIQGSLSVVSAGNLKRPILLELLDYSVGDQYFDAWDEGAVFESRHGDGVNVTQIIWLYWPDMIAKTTT